MQARNLHSQRWLKFMIVSKSPKMFVSSPSPQLSLSSLSCCIHVFTIHSKQIFSAIFVMLSVGQHMMPCTQCIKRRRVNLIQLKSLTSSWLWKTSPQTDSNNPFENELVTYVCSVAVLCRCKLVFYVKPRYTRIHILCRGYGFRRLGSVWKFVLGKELELKKERKKNSSKSVDSCAFNFKCLWVYELWIFF